MNAGTFARQAGIIVLISVTLVAACRDPLKTDAQRVLTATSSGLVLALGTGGKLVAFDTSAGRERWRVPSDIQTSWSQHRPAVTSQGCVPVGGQAANADIIIECLQPSDGHRAWQIRVPSAASANSTMVGTQHRGWHFFAVSNYGTATVIARNDTSGTCWSRALDLRMDPSLVHAGSRIAVLGRSECHILDVESGRSETQWQSAGRTVAYRDTLIWIDGVGDDTRLKAHNLETGQTRIIGHAPASSWVHDIGRYRDTWVVQVMFPGHRAAVLGFDDRAGDPERGVVWRVDLPDGGILPAWPPELAGGLHSAAFGELIRHYPVISVLSSTAQLHWIDLETRQTRVEDFPASIAATGVFRSNNGFLVLAHDHIVIHDSAGRLTRRIASDLSRVSGWLRGRMVWVDGNLWFPDEGHWRHIVVNPSPSTEK